jgi:superfamily II DNA or RNA helicase
MELVNKPTIVTVPTFDLLERWRGRMQDELSIGVGAYGGGEGKADG